MTDVNSRDMRAQGHDGATGADNRDIVELIELLFFAYRDFVSDPDELLKKYGFGRAHHRVVHFVGRNPGMRVAELLEILRITKQSLGRVLRELIDKGFVYQREGVNDRRQRLLYLTRNGTELHLALMKPQIGRFEKALEGLDETAREQARTVLYKLINPDDRAQARRLTGHG